MEVKEEFLEKGLSLLPQVHQTKVPVAVEKRMKKPLGQQGSVWLDFGRHLTGRLHLRFGYQGSHPDAPVKLKIHFAEMERELEEDAEGYHGWICPSWIQQEQVYVDVIPGELTLPRRYAFRYVRIEVLAISSKFMVTLEDAYAVAESSAEESMLVPFKTDDPLDQAMDTVACNTLRDCMQRVFEDGPKRDRRLWIGDLRLQALANYETYQLNDMVKGCLYLFAALPMENGQIGACLFLEPEPEVDDTKMFDYSLLFIPTLWDYFQATGDKETLLELWETARRQICIAEESIGGDFVVPDSDVMGWCFLDWSLDLNKQAGAQGVMLYALRNAIAIAEEIGDVKDAQLLREKYAKYKKAAKEHFWDEEAGLFVSGKGRQISFASQIWMVLGGAVEGTEASELLKRVEERVDAVGMVTPYLHHHYIQAKLDAGKKEDAFRIMRDYWGGMVNLGADTFWELYNPENPEESPYGGTIVNSYCHAWSCGPAYFLRKYQ